MKGLIILLIITFIISCSNDGSYSSPKIEGSLPVIIIVGQSNAEGYVPMEMAPEWLSSNNYKMDNYLMWNRNKLGFDTYILGTHVGSENNSDTRFGFDIFFAKKYIETYKSQLLAIKQTYPGIPISERGSQCVARWNPDVEKIPMGERRMVEELAKKISDAQLYALKNNVKLIPIAILYMQGEADAEETVRLNDFEENFKNLTYYLRNIAGVDNIPIINADIMYRNSNYKKINEIFHLIDKIDPFLKTVRMEQNQTSLGDNLHYNKDAFEYMGYKMFEYYQEMNKLLESDVRFFDSTHD